MKVLQIQCSCPSRETAVKLSRGLIEQHLAACVQIVPHVRSIYRWKDSIEESDEWLLLIKSAEDRFEQVKDYLDKQHPYELPEVIAVEANAGLLGYLDWVITATRTP